MKVEEIKQAIEWFEHLINCHGDELDGEEKQWFGLAVKALQNELERAEGCPCWYDSENQWIVTACGCYINYYDDIEEYENGYCATCGKRLDLTEVYEALQPTEGE